MTEAEAERREDCRWCARYDGAPCICTQPCGAEHCHPNGVPL